MGVNVNKGIEFKNDWEEIYFLSLGTYFQTIINELSKEIAIPDLSDKKFVSEELIPIPKNWKWFQIKEVIEFSTNLNIEKELPADAIINYIDIDAIDNKRYKIREVKQRAVSELSSRARRVLKKNYLLYSLVRPYLNNVAIIEDDRDKFIGSTGFAVFKGTLVDNTFLKYFLLSDFIRERFLNMLSGFNSPTITQEQFTGTPIPVPPLSEQKKIVSFLNRLEKNEIGELGKHLPYNVESKIIKLHNAQLNGIILKKELNKQQTYLQQLSQSILQEAVQGKLTQQNPTDEPASKLLERIKAEKQKLIAAGKLKKEKELAPITADEIPFELPDGWVWCRLNDLLSFDKYSMKRGPFGSSLKKDMFVSKGIRVFEQYNPINDDPYWARYFINEKQYEELKAFTAIPGDLLISCSGATLGRITEIPTDTDFGIINQALLKLTINKSVMSNDYFKMLFRSSFLQDKILEEAGGSAIPNMVGVNVLKALLIPLPSLSEQHRILTKVQHLLAGE